MHNSFYMYWEDEIKDISNNDRFYLRVIKLYYLLKKLTALNTNWTWVSLKYFSCTMFGCNK